MLLSKYKNVLAAVVGVAIAVTPMAGFNYWLDQLIQQQGQEEVYRGARRSISLAEMRLDGIIASLDELVKRGVDSCQPAHLDILRQTAFAVTPIKELSVVGPGGETLCSDLGSVIGERRPISSQRVSGSSGEFVLEVFHVDARKDNMVRIKRQTGGGNALAALMPADLLLAQVSMGASFTTASTLTLRDRTLVATGGTPSPLPDTDSFVATLSSDRYGLTVNVKLPRRIVVASHSELRDAGIGIATVIALVILVFANFVPRRHTSANPVNDLDRAIAAGEFVPFYQPIVDIQSGQVCGAEVLVRWRNADGTFTLPSAFIPLMESSGLIWKLTRVLMRRTCGEVGEAFRQRPTIRIGFNLAPRDLANDDIVKEISDIFGNSPIQLSQVVLEVTERHAIENLTETRRVIASLQGLGVRIAMDDVGAGHSGLSYMLKLGVDIIKIDKMFIDAIGNDRHSTTIIETLIDLARNLRMEVVAEGVENFEQVVCLRDLGIGRAQGYVFAPPLPGPLFLQLLESIDPLPAASDEQPSQALPAVTASSRLAAA